MFHPNEIPVIRGIAITGNPNAMRQYAGEHGCRTYIANEKRVCMAPETVIHDGRMYCNRHRPIESKLAPRTTPESN